MKHQTNVFFILVSFAVLSVCLSCEPAQISVDPDKLNGTYEVGETVEWTIELPSNIELDSLSYTIKKGGLTAIKKGFIYPEDKIATISHQFNEPGAVLLDIRWRDENKELQKVIGGAIASPEKIVLSANRPDDFDAFWDSQIERLKKIPKNPRLKEMPDLRRGVEYYKTTLDNINGSTIQGQLARPKKGEKFPALLIVQWAGVYPLQRRWVLDKAKEGWLVLNINPHDLPIDQDELFYTDLNNGPLKNYPRICNEDKYTSYFLRMYLSCYRAAQYLTERSDWNGETLVVMGASQGGLQSLITAALHPKITASLALVPAGFDMYGPVLGRKGGWPQWYNAIDYKDENEVRETSRYYDVANFVPLIKCPVLVGIGLLDQTCPPEGIFAGMSSGGAVATALKVANQIEKGVIVAIICDRGDRYLSSTLFEK